MMTGCMEYEVEGPVPDQRPLNGCVCVCVIVDCSACFVADCISRQHNAIGQAHSSIRQFFPFSLACVREDCQACKLNKEDAMDRCKWRKMIKEAR